MATQPQANAELLACTLPSAELALRRSEIQQLLSDAGTALATGDGVSLTFPNSSALAHAIVDFMQFEQHFCAALSYVLQSNPPHTQLVLHLHAPEELVASVQRFYAGGL